MNRWGRAWVMLVASWRAFRARNAYVSARDIDCAAAAALANQPLDTTVSAWTARNRDAGNRWACIFCALLTIGFNLFHWRRVTRDHCDEAVGHKD